jgi:hypothetical protein
VSDRSGAGLVELAVLQTLEALTAGRPRAHVSSARALAGIEERIGLGPRYGYELLADLARPWMIPIRTVSGLGNFGDRDFPQPSEPPYTVCRQSHVGQLILDAEARRLAPVPVGLINGTTYRGGTQPSLEPFRVLATLRRLLDHPRTTDADLLRAVGPPYSVTGCDITGDLDALFKGRRTVIRETGRVIITGVPVPELAADRPVPPGRRGWTGSSPRFDPPVHLIIESLPAQTSTADAAGAIADRAKARRWHASHPELARRTSLPITEVYDLSTHYQIRIGVVLEPGTDPTAARDQVAAIDGITLEHTLAFPAPLASMLRSWVDRHGLEDITASLDRLRDAIRRDRRRELRNR